MKRGLFISIEGPDGAGKSTQIAYLREFFDGRGVGTIFTREPGGTAISEKLRAIILSNENAEMAARTEALLYAASRAQIVDELIEPALASGKTVVCDRYVDSSIAYQGYGRDLGGDVAEINRFATGGLMPDLTILLALDPEQGMERITSAGSGKDRLESEALAFHKRVYQGYVALAKADPDRIKMIDASLPIEEVRREIERDVTALLERKDG